MEEKEFPYKEQLNKGLMDQPKKGGRGRGCVRNKKQHKYKV